MFKKSVETLKRGVRFAPHQRIIRNLAQLCRDYRQPSITAKALEWQKHLLEICDSYRKIGEADWIWIDAVEADPENSGLPMMKSLITFYEDKLSSESDEPYLWKLLGTLYCQTGDIDKAAPYFRQYIQWRKEHMPGAVLNVYEDRDIKVTGLLAELADLYEIRLQSISEDMIGVDLIKTIGGKEPTLQALLELYFRLQNYPRLASVFRQICCYGARAIWALDRFAADNSAIGLTREETIELLKKMKKSCTDPILWIFMGDLCRRAYRIDFEKGAYMIMDSVGDPKEFYRHAIEMDDKEPIAYGALGDLFFSQKKYQDAAAAYERASELAPTQPYYTAQLAHCYSGMEKHEAAIQIVQQLVEQMPDDKDVHRVLGVVYFNASGYEKAIEQFHLGLDDEDMEYIITSGKAIIYLLARAYHHAKRYEESETLLNKVR